MNHKDMLGLKVGDLVCDCRFKHLEIKELSESSIPTQSLSKYWGWLPTFAYDVLYRFWPKRVVDKNLTLEDGSNCSATHCCDLAPHDWQHPKK